MNTQIKVNYTPLNFVGLEINHDHKTGFIYLSQCKCIDRIVNIFEFSFMDNRLTIPKSMIPNDDIEFYAIVGALM